MMKMETEIGNRGSKLIIVCTIHTFVIIVKEQRVDGSWWKKFSNTRPKINQCFSHLRCILMGFERNYQVLSLSNIIHTYRGNSSLATHQCSIENFKLDPWLITGFIDGEGCFSINISKNNKRKTGWAVKLSFTIALHKKDKAVLQKIQSSLGVGKIYEHGPQSNQLRVESLKELELVFKHFQKYPLITKKWADLKLSLIIKEIMMRNEHLTEDGLRQIVAIKAAMNLGLSEKLKFAFPHVVPVKRPLVELPQTIDPYWLAGFTSAEGCFMIKIQANETYSLGFQVILKFQLTQDERDEQLMRILIEYLNCGYMVKTRTWVEFRVTKLNDIIKIIIPFFQKHRILGVKALDFADWCLVASMMKDKKHLTKDGLEKIKKIKAGINRGRNLR